ncbi:MAG: hypothetical protein E2P02_19755 [Acidobacteria bacterium]|nr:MAG: hypothetical protein E2P02_19755 [Acidobacteriota bacterium]
MSTDSETLVLVGDPKLEPGEIQKLRELHASGATIVAWQHSKIVQDRFPSPDVQNALAALSVPSITPGGREDIDFDIEETVIAWMKELGKSFRKRFRYKPLTLWWWAELYLYHETPLRLAIRDVELLARVVDRRQPARILLLRPLRALETAARQMVPEVEVIGEPVDGPTNRTRTTRLHVTDYLKMMGTGLKSVLRSPPEGDGRSPKVFFLTHGSMWRRSEVGEPHEMYFDRILPATSSRASTSVVAFGPPVPFEHRGVGASTRDVLELGEDALPYVPIRRYLSWSLTRKIAPAFAECRQMWRRFERDAELTHRGVALGPEALACFRDMFYRQLPWAIRVYHEVRSVLETEKPDVLVLYAESSGLGRAAVTAAKEFGIPSFAIQHGIMYPQYYSHEHRRFELDGDDAVPIPTKTAVYGRLAKDLLVKRGNYPEDRIVITGSPKFDALVRAAEGFDREKTRTELRVPEGARFLVLATRFNAVGPVFSDLVEAVERLEDVWLFVKPHQAEAPTPYEAILARGGAPHTRMLSGKKNLLELLFASDGLITVDSFASSEALVLGRPVLVVNLPNNLSALVERGVALGASSGASLERELRKLLFDEKARKELEEKRKEYIQEFAFGADGRSTERIVEAILATCKS